MSKSASSMKLKHEYETGNRCLTVKVTKATIVKKVVELQFVVPQILLGRKYCNEKSSKDEIRVEKAVKPDRRTMDHDSRMGKRGLEIANSLLTTGNSLIISQQKSNSSAAIFNSALVLVEVVVQALEHSFHVQACRVRIPGQNFCLFCLDLCKVRTIQTPDFLFESKLILFMF